MRALYNFGILLYGLAIKLASIGNSKAKLWTSGRRNLFERLSETMKNDGSPLVWIHCASLGEFEQGRPLIEKIKSANPSVRILLTFFSPSGYEVRKKYPGADYVFYMPLDTPYNAQKFVEIVNPTMVIFVKYEFWLNHLEELKRRNIPHYLVSAIFRDDQIFFKPRGRIFRNALENYTHVFTQDQNSLSLLKNINLKNVSIAGDTRFDRVHEIAKASKDILLTAAFVGKTDRVIVAGSTWNDDEKILFPCLKNHFVNGWKMIIAPHEISEERLDGLESSLLKNGITQDHIIRFSRASETSAAQAQVLVIDNIGMLSSLYRYGSVAFIGGGFGKSIHNTLEAAVYGIPVIFGPKYGKFNEALGLIDCKGGFGVHSSAELASTLDHLLNDEDFRITSGKFAGEFVNLKTGATKIILSGLKL